MIRRTSKQYDIVLDDLAANARLSRAAFSHEVEALTLGRMGHQSLAKDNRTESTNAWFKRNAYRMLKRYVDTNQTRVFDQAIRSSNRHPIGLDAIRANPFKLGLFAMFDDTSLSRSDRHVFGNQMLYAHQHEVPAEHLIAFIRAAGAPSRIAAKLLNGSREPSINFG